MPCKCDGSDSHAGHKHPAIIKAVSGNKKPKTKIADKGGKCQAERAAISSAAKGRPKGLALAKLMACKRGSSKKKHK